MSELRYCSCAGLFGMCVGVVVWVSAPVLALSNSTGPNGCNVQAVHALGYTGQNIKIGLLSAAHARVTHEAFDGAVSWYDATGEDQYEPFWHDTPMAGMLCSRGGALYPDHKGAAPGAEVLSVRATRPIPDSNPTRDFCFDWIADGLNEIKEQNCRVVVTGIQLPYPAHGESSFSLLYDYYAYTYDMVFATASGNFASSVTVFGDTYNSITTGGLFIDENGVYHRVGVDQNGLGSNSGPTIDGRRKPEVVAPSQGQIAPTNSNNTTWNTATPDHRGQTSWAVPHTGGVAAVLLSYADTTDEPDDGRSEVIKAVMVNSTFPNSLAKNGQWTAPAQNVWHPDRGYGRLDALRAYKTLIAPKIAPGQTTAESRGWAYRQLAPSGLPDSYYIEAAANARLVTTVTWHRKINKQGKNYSAETNDLSLDLRIFDPDGGELFADCGGRDNLRKADILVPVDGMYEVRITPAVAQPNRAYALAFEVLTPFEGDLNNDHHVNLADLGLLADDWLVGSDLADFETLAVQWWMADGRYVEP